MVLELARIKQGYEVTTPPTAPRWMSVVLQLAGAYNLAWGAWVVFFPTASFAWSGLAEPDKPLLYPQLWQCIGMIVGVYGVGYLAASLAPLRHWPVVLVGVLGKLFGPIGFAYGLSIGHGFNPAAVITHLLNDLIWLIPFAMILRQAAVGHWNEAGKPTAEPFESIAPRYADAFGVSLVELSRRSPVLLVFLRHFGCTYCRETMTDLAAARATIEAAGTRIAVVHMGSPAEADAFFAKYGLADVPRFSDPDCHLYRAVGLKRGSLWQHFGPKSLKRFPEAVGHGLGRVVGDGFRMPGAFLVRDGHIVREFRPESVADKFDYCALAGCKVA